MTPKTVKEAREAGLTSLNTYHLAWLSVHPNRTAEWLDKTIKDGFDIHHLDGNHKNDHPSNLILIDCLDHSEVLHGLKSIRMMVQLCNNPANRWPEWMKRWESKGETAYGLRRQGLRWQSIARGMGADKGLGEGAYTGRVAHLAKNYAKGRGLPWPLPKPIGGWLDELPYSTANL